jgi:hypothetical protein
MHRSESFGPCVFGGKCVVRQIRHERPLPKTSIDESNPNNIVINQHVIPASHLLEWSIDKKMVEVFDIESGNTKSISAKSSYFCAMRLWDQWTEKNMLKTNEDNYQSQIELIKNGRDISEPDFIMAYYVLLCVRVWVATKERPHYPSELSKISHEHNQAELEDNELEMDGSIHIINPTIDSNSQHMDRQTVKIAMNSAFTQWCRKMKSTSWRIYERSGESFILSDAFYNNMLCGLHVLPISPDKVIIADSTYTCLESNNLLSADHINTIMRSNAVNYYVQTPCA